MTKRKILYTSKFSCCVDTDECTAGMDDCHVNSKCTNTKGSFACTCNQGYHGNETYCQGKEPSPSSYVNSMKTGDIGNIIYHPVNFVRDF